VKNVRPFLPSNVTIQNALCNIHTYLPVTKTEEMRSYAAFDPVAVEKSSYATHGSGIWSVEEEETKYAGRPSVYGA
jgi:hypothetical protein